MEFIKENFELIFITFTIFIIVLIIINIIISHKVIGGFINKKYKIKLFIDVNAVDGTKIFLMHVYNNNINDIRLVSMGINYQNLTIDYTNHYLTQNSFPLSQKISIPSRGYVILKIDINDLKNILGDIKKKNKLKNINAYLIDSSGNQVTIKGTVIKKYLKKMFKEDEIKLKKVRKNQQKEIKLEKKLNNNKKRLLKKAIRKDRWHRFKFKFKRLFKK